MAEDVTRNLDEEPPRDPVDRLAEEFIARYRRGEAPAISQYIDRHPELADEIRLAFPAMMIMERLVLRGEQPSSASVRPALGCETLHQLGEYHILREVGRGGMGVVYEAEQESLGRRVALKVLPFHSMLSATHRERFRREAQAAARLHHSNIVPVFGIGEENGIHYYAMQFIHGQSLDKVIHELQRLRALGEPGTASGSGSDGLTASVSQLLLGDAIAGGEGAARALERQDGGPGSPQGDPAGPAVSAGAPPEAARPLRHHGTAVGSASSWMLLDNDSGAASRHHYFRSIARVGQQIAEALSYAHGEGILHRDVKPSNLLLDTAGVVWVADFGLAKAEGSESLTEGGDIVGTVPYMAPERLEGWSDPRSDVYSLGVTLYELATLSRPFDDTDRHRLMRKVAEEEAPRPRRLDRHVPRDLETIVLKAIEKEPGKRYQTATQLGEDLERFLAGEPVWARRSGPLERALKWTRRRPAVATSAAALVLLAVAVGLLARGRILESRHGRLARYDGMVVEAMLAVQRGRPSVPAVETAPMAVEDGPRAEPIAARLEVSGGAGPDPVEEAAQTLAAAIELAPARPDGYYHRARALVVLRRDDEALLEIRRALAHDPTFVPAKLLAREILQGQPADAELSFPEIGGAIGEGAAWATAYEAAWRAREAKRWAEAEKANTEILALESGPEPYLGLFLGARLGRGLARLEIEDLDGALEDFTAARARWPELIDPVLYQARTYHLKGNRDRAGTILEEFHARCRFPDTFAVSAAALSRRLERYDEALAWLERAAPSQRREHVRAGVLLGLWRLDEAARAAEAAVRLDPADASARVTLGLIYEQQERHREAIAELREATRLEPKDFAAYHYLGHSHVSLREYEEAERAHLAALAIDDDDAATYFHLGWVRGEQERYDESERDYIKAIELDPKLSPPHNNLGWTRLKQGRPADAIGPYLSALELDPRSVQTRRGCRDTLSSLLESVPRSGAFANTGLEQARRALELVGGEDADLLSIVARFEACVGNDRSAVLALERLRSLSSDQGDVGDRITRLRAGLLPDIASLTSAEDLVATLAPGSEEEQKLLAGFAAIATDAERREILHYLEGRAHERAGRPREAAESFIESALVAGGREETFLRLAASLRAAGDVERAWLWVGRAIAQGQADSAALWGLWARLALVDLGMTTAEALAAFPIEAAGTGIAAELRWGLEQLAAPGAVEIPTGAFEGPDPDVPGRLYALALETRSPSLWSAIAARVSRGQTVRTARAGGGGGGDFEETPAAGALLVGFDMKLATFNRRETVSSLRPLFITASGVLRGRITGGGGTGGSFQRVEARPGYAAGGVVVEASSLVHGLKVVFMKIREGILDPTDAYESSWIGGDSPRADTPLGGAGAPVVGVFARSGLLIDGLGLVIADPVPHYAAVDAAVESGDAAVALEWLQALAAADQDASHRAGYLEARLLQAAGRLREAVARLEALVARDVGRPEPLLGLVDGLEAAGESSRAEALLREGLEKDPGNEKIWERWARCCLLELGRRPAEALAAFPATPGADGPGAELHWSLERLRAAGAPIAEDVLRAAGPPALSSRIAAVAIEATHPGFWSWLRERVAAGRTARTELTGAERDANFTIVPQEGVLLIGFSGTLSWLDDVRMVRTIEPVFLGPRGTVRGPIRGEPGGEPFSVKARPGYAIGAIVVEGAQRVHGFQAVFMKITGGGLDPGDAYPGPWIGAENRFEKKTVGSGEPVVGIYGMSGADVDALGLVVGSFLPSDHVAVDDALEAVDVLLPESAAWRVDRGGGPAPASWTEPGFDDGAWARAVMADVHDGVSGPLRLRGRFHVTSPDSFRRLFLSVRGDADSSAWLNGQPVAAVRLEDRATWTPHEVAHDPRPASPLLDLRFDLDRALLVPGDNVLAITSTIDPGGASPVAAVTLAGAPARPLVGEGFEVFRASARRRNTESLLPYLDGRLLQLAGKHQEAAVKFDEAVKLGEGHAAPLTRLIECLRAEGDGDGAHERVVDAIVSGSLSAQDALQVCVGIPRAALERRGREILAALNHWAPRSGKQNMALAALKEYIQSGILRIDCGGPGYRSPAGVPWAPDCLFDGGQTSECNTPLARDDAPLLRTERWFRPIAGRLQGYRIPLAPGRYLVTLHLAELHFRQPGARLFDIAVEGRREVADPEPLWDGAAVPQARRVVTDVRDGKLDIEFMNRVDIPQVSALEVERLEGEPGAEATPGASEEAEGVARSRAVAYHEALREFHLARKLRHRNRHRQAEASCRRAIALLEEVLTPMPVRGPGRVLQAAYEELTAALEGQGRPEEAAAARRERGAVGLRIALLSRSLAAIDAALAAPEALVAESAEWRFFRGLREPPPSWTSIDFDDAAWQSGPGGFGYEDGNNATVLDDMRNGYTTVYVRHRFSLPDPVPSTAVVLRVVADDGFVAFLNGEEVGRARAGEPGRALSYRAVATASAEEPPHPVDLPLPARLLRPTENVLAIQGLNASVDSSDFSLIATLLVALDRERLYRDLRDGLEAGGAAPEKLAYLDGRRLEEAGDFEGAAARFRVAVAAAQHQPEQTLRLAACLRAAGRPAEACDILDAAIRDNAVPESEIVELWLAITLLDLRRGPERAQVALPEPARRRSRALEPNLIWIADQLAAGAVRINCGGGEYRSRGGTPWGADRFFLSGYRFFGDNQGGATAPFTADVARTEDDPLYQTERWFPEDPAGYRIPLPPGRYRVTLHFAEIFFRDAGTRVFDVLVEEKLVLPGHDPGQVGFAVAARHAVDIDVRDGSLDVRLVRRIDAPKLSAIEIEPID